MLRKCNLPLRNIENPSLFSVFGNLFLEEAIRFCVRFIPKKPHDRGHRGVSRVSRRTQTLALMNSPQRNDLDKWMNQRSMHELKGSLL